MALLVVACTTSGVATAQTFTAVTPTSCPAVTQNLFTTGGQYLDANNGVLPNSWSMLMRWQGNLLNPVNYDPSQYTFYETNSPHSQYQRGYQPESQIAATPVTQFEGCQAGMILNSWYAPHTAVLGGGWNDMFGYSWSAAAMPWAFKTLNGLGQFVPAELVLQGNLAVPRFDGYVETNGAWSQAANPSQAGSAQLDFFVYLQDVSHPSLHPIAVLAGAFAPGFAGCATEKTGFVGWDYASGVWFGSSGFCNTDISTIRYTAGVTTGTTFDDLTFYRVHYTPANFTALIDRINGQQCSAGVSGSCACVPGRTCPQNGYSRDPGNYKVQYTGIIAETSLCDATGCGTQLTDRNIGMSVGALGVAAYHYTNP